MSNALETRIVAAAEVVIATDRKVHRASPLVVAGSVESHALRGASRRYLARVTVFGGALGSL